MRPIYVLNDLDLIWQPRKHGHNQFDLLAGPEGAEEIAGSLLWQKGFGTLALAQTAEGSWTFKRSGFWHTKVTIRPAGIEQDIGIFEPGMTGKGTLNFINGVSYRFDSEGFWQRHWSWQDANGNPLIRFESKAGWLKLKGQANLEPAAFQTPDLPLLVSFGWYLVVLMAADSASAATIAAAT